MAPAGRLGGQPRAGLPPDERRRRSSATAAARSTACRNGGACSRPSCPARSGCCASGPKGVREGKLLDALADLWTARRILARAITRLADPPAWDNDGRPHGHRLLIVRSRPGTRAADVAHWGRGVGAMNIEHLRDERVLLRRRGRCGRDQGALPPAAPVRPAAHRRRGRRVAVGFGAGPPPARHPAPDPRREPGPAPRRPGHPGGGGHGGAAARRRPLAAHPLPARGDRRLPRRRKRDPRRGRGGGPHPQPVPGPRHLPFADGRDTRGRPSSSRDPRAPARPIWPRPWPARRECPSSSCPPRPSSRCSTGRPTARSGRTSPQLRKAARREGGAIGFIEEIDAIGATRAGMGQGGGREGIAGVVNELLIQLQSFDQPPWRVRWWGGVVELVNRLLPGRPPAAQAARAGRPTCW